MRQIPVQVQTASPGMLLGAAMVFSVCGVLGLTLAGYFIGVDLGITRHRVEVEATVTHRYTGGKNGPRIRYSYEFEEGRYVDYSDTEDPAAVPGARIRIELDRTHPRNTRLAGNTDSRPWWALLISFVILGVGVRKMKGEVEAILAASPRWRARQAKKDGQLFEKNHLAENLRTLPALRTWTLRPIAKTLAQPETKIVGRVRYLRQPLVAPLSKRPCAGYQVIVEAQHDGQVKEVLCEAKVVDFRVEDDTGTALVRTANDVSLVLVKDVHQCSLLFSELPPELVHFLSRTEQLVSVNPQAVDPLCFREGVLTEGELVMVAGEGQWEADPSHDAQSYREPARRLLMAASPGRPLVISDDPEATAGGASGDVVQAGGPGEGGTSGRAAG